MRLLDDTRQVRNPAATILQLPMGSLSWAPLRFQRRKEMRGSVRLGRLFGIDIDVDYSWLIIFGLVT